MQEVVLLRLYDEPDPDQAPFPPVRQQVAEQRAAGKTPIEVFYVGDESDLDEEDLGGADILIVTRFDSAAPVTKSIQLAAGQDLGDEEVDDNAHET